MSNYNNKTQNMYKNGGALEYIQRGKVEPETEKWNRLLNYIEESINNDKSKKIIEFGSGAGQLAILLQQKEYDITATDIIDDFLNEERKLGIKNIKKFDFLNKNFKDVFLCKADLIISWRNPHLDIDDMKKLFNVAYNGLNNDGLFIVNFQNADVHPEAEVLSNGTKYNYKILEDKKTKEKRFFAYYTKTDIEELIKDLFIIEKYHTEGGNEQKNWHVLTLRKVIQ